MDENEEKKIRRDAFVAAFRGRYGERVLEHLSNFCIENNDNFDANNERSNAYFQGRRSVMLEIRKQLKEEENQP